MDTTSNKNIVPTSRPCPHCGLPPDEKKAPVQGFQPGIPWSMHLRAYDVYCNRYSPQKALIEGGCRGGFGVYELDMFIPGWREELSVMSQLKAEVTALRSEIVTLKQELQQHEDKQRDNSG